MIKFAGKSLPSFAKVVDIKYSILPPIDSKTEQVYGRAGSYDFGVELGERLIEVQLLIIADNQNDVIKKARELSTFLFYKELQPLILLDEADKQYMARVVGDTEVAELYRTGQATISFLCPSPYAESLVEKVVNVSPTDHTPILVTNNGSAETYPIIELTMKKSATSIAMISNDKFVQIGNDDVPDKTPTNLNPVVLADPMTSYTGWTPAIKVDGGTIEGVFASTGNVLAQSGKDYGTGVSWHGASAIKSLSRPVQDFVAVGRVGLIATNINQMARVEMYLLDENNVHIGKIAMVDKDRNGHYAKAEARVGDIAGGTMFVQSYGAKKGVFGSYDGVLQISRVGRQWTAYFGKVDANGKHHTRLTQTWYDTNNLYSTKKLAKIQIHIGVWGEELPVNTLHFSDLKVTETLKGNTDTMTPLLFDVGDVVTIDNQRAIVLKNGEPIFSELDPSSDFFSLDTGANGLVVSPPSAGVKIRYKEKWL